MKKKLPIIIAVVLIISAIAIFMYPTVSEWINKAYEKETILEYNKSADTMTESEKEQYLESARNYNKKVSTVISDGFSEEAFDVSKEYENVLNITDEGQMGTVEIPKISCHLPIYHGSDEKMLTKGAVHLAATSVPIGGTSTHAVLSAHTAYPGKELFNRLTELQVGDMFYVTVLGDKMAYKVTEINTVLPTETEKLQVVPGKDLVTLTTCTPYSVNTHRLLVTGERTELIEENTVTQEDVEKMVFKSDPMFLLIPVLLIPVAVRIILKGLKKRNEKKTMS